MANKTVFVAVLMLGIIIAQGYVQNFDSSDEINKNLVDSFESIPSEDSAELDPKIVDSWLDSTEIDTTADESFEDAELNIPRFNITRFIAGQRNYRK